MLFRVLFLSILLGLLPVVLSAGHSGKSAPKLSREAQQALYDAQQAQEKEQRDKAVTILNTFLQNAKAEGGDIPAAAYLMLGNAHYHLGNLNAAINIFAEGAAAFPGTASLHLNLAIVRYAAEDLTAAALDFRKAFALYQADGDTKPEILYQAAVCHYQAENLREAKADMQDLWALEPTKVNNAWSSLWIQLLCALEEWPAAEKAILNHLRTHRNDSVFWKLLAQVRANRNRYEQAVVAFEIAHSLAPLSASDLRMLADLYFYLDAPLSGARTLLQATIGTPKAKDLDRLARAYARAMRTEEAIVYARQALKADPTAARLLMLGRFLAEAGRHEEVLDLCQKEAHNDTENGELVLLAGLSALEMGRTDTAKSLFQRAKRDKKSAAQAAVWQSVLDELASEKQEALSAAGTTDNS